MYFSSSSDSLKALGFLTVEFSISDLRGLPLRLIILFSLVLSCIIKYD